MRALRTEVVIKASPAKIWSILMDFEKYPEWNPFILSIIGRADLNERLKVTMQAENSKARVFKPTVTMVQKGKVFAWLGSLPIPGLFIGHHIFEIMEKDGQCLFVHREEFKGLLVSLLWKDINTKVRAGFIAMNDKIKFLAEQ